MNTELNTLNSLSDRLNYAINLLGTKKADLARAIGVKPQVIQFLCSSNTQSSRFTFEIATVLGLNTRWLATGEGAIFIADDPKQQFFQTYKRIPLLTFEMVKDIFINKNPMNQESISIWLPLITEEDDTFAIKMPDTSMEPHFPIDSYVFIKECSKETLYGCKFIFSYLNKFDTFVVREITKDNSEKILTPKNIELFKEIKITDEVTFIGVVTDCCWHVRS